jgi:phage terminase large subunit-like protein
MLPSKNFQSFCEKFLSHTKGAKGNQPLKLDDWQVKDIIRPLFDTRLEDGRRQYRKCLVMIGRKNGKTTLAAAVALYMLFVDNEPGAEILSAACDSDQAALAFDIAKQMITQSPILSKKCKVYRRHIEAQRGAIYKVIAADASGNLGHNISTLIFDELLTQKSRDLYESLVTSMGARSEPLAFMISTSGHDRGSLCYELYHYAKQVRDGVVIDPTFLPVIYEAPQESDWKNEATWRIANPGLDKSVTLEYLRDTCHEAQNNPAREQSFRQFHLNQWVESAARWIGSEAWNSCESNPVGLEEVPCYAALDLSSRTDLTSFTLAFPITGSIHLKTFTWTTSAMVGKRKDTNRIRYDSFIRDGWLESIPGEIIDYEVILQRITEIAEQYRIREIACDPWNAEFLMQKLEAAGYIVKEFRQGFRTMSPPTKDFEAAVLQKQISHDGNPLLRWCIDNVVIEYDAAGNAKPSKKRSVERIDAAVSSIMAFARARTAEATGIDGTSIYENRNFLFM